MFAQITLYIRLANLIYHNIFPIHSEKLLKMNSDAELCNRHNGAMTTTVHLALRRMREMSCHYNQIHHVQYQYEKNCLLNMKRFTYYVIITCIL